MYAVRSIAPIAEVRGRKYTIRQGSKMHESVKGVPAGIPMATISWCMGDGRLKNPTSVP
jgi:hypothetical protein